MSAMRISPLVCGVLFGTALAIASTTALAQNRQFSFAYDQPKGSGYDVGADMFNKKLMELSKGTFSINNIPAPSSAPKRRPCRRCRPATSISCCCRPRMPRPRSRNPACSRSISSSAMKRHAIKVLGDPTVIAAMKELYAAKMTGAHMIGLGSQGLRHMYGKKPIEKVADLKGVKMRVQATVTEDATFPAYGAQVVHMPFGEVYTSLQTGVADMAENGINNYLINKHYEVAPVLSLTEHEANNAALFVSDKVWSSLTDEQKKWVQAAADEVSKNEPTAAFKLEHEALAKLEKIGVKVVKNVDKSGFSQISKPIQDKLASDLGPNAVKVLDLVRNVK